VIIGNFFHACFVMYIMHLISVGHDLPGAEIDKVTGARSIILAHMVDNIELRQKYLSVLHVWGAIDNDSPAAFALHALSESHLAVHLLWAVIAGPGHVCWALNCRRDVTQVLRTRRHALMVKHRQDFLICDVVVEYDGLFLGLNKALLAVRGTA
jgi:hypothetical protein